MNFYDFVRDDLRDLKPFQSARRSASEGKVRLNANECPWPPAVSNADHYNRYPNPQDKDFLLSR